MKILITTVFFPPQNAIASQRPYVWAREWARAGIDVTVLTIQKDESKTDLAPRTFAGFKVLEISAGEIINSFRARRQNTVVARNAEATLGPRKTSAVREWLRRRGFLSSVRLPDVFDFWMPQVWRVLQTQETSYDVIVSTFGPHASLWAGYLAKRRSPRAKWIIDFRDLWVENHVYAGFWPITLIERFLERFYLRRADAVTTVSEALARSLQKKVPAKPVVVFENGFDPEELDQVVQTAASMQVADRLTLVYTGSLHSEHRNPAVFLEAFATLPVATRDRFEIIFAGPREAFVDDLIRKFTLEQWARQIGSVGRTKALELQLRAVVLLFFEKQHIASRDGVLTGKLFEYLASARPIWAFGIDETSVVGKLLKESGSGRSFGVNTNDVQLALIELYKAGAAASRNVADPADVMHRYNRNQIALRMLKWIEKICSPA